VGDIAPTHQVQVLPPHHFRKVKFAKFSLVLSVEQRKDDFELWADLDFT
jgi:hypothetical protein